MTEKNNNNTDEGESAEDNFYISDNVVEIYMWVVYSVVCLMIGIFGIVTNIINIICYVKQGFKDSVNISLLGLSVSDLGSLVTMVWMCISVTPAFSAADLPYESMEVTYLAIAMPHFSFNRVSSCITAMITLERCMCITAPLKVGTIFTSNATNVATICIFIIFFCSATPVYVVNRLDFTFSPMRNKTIFGLVFMKEREYVEMISFAVNNFTIPFAAFAIIVICTLIISIKLEATTKWRIQTFTRPHVDRVSIRNQKVAKMVVMISTLFIICFVPISVIMLVLGLVPEFTFQRKYFKIAAIVSGICYTLECINSSMNIFIYYHMSSRYRDIFCRICRGMQKG